MEYTPLGKTGLTVSVAGLGAGLFDLSFVAPDAAGLGEHVDR